MKPPIIHDKDVAWVDHIVGILDNGSISPERLKSCLESATIIFNEKGKNGQIDNNL